MDRKSSIVTVLIFLPANYNPDESGKRPPVETELLELTAAEVASELGEGGTLYDFGDHPPKGFWWDQGIVAADVLRVLEVDMEDTSSNRRWLRDYVRRVLLPRFRQKAIYVKYILPAERLVVTDEELTN